MNEVLEKNNELAWRIANMQLQSESPDIYATSIIKYPLASIDEATSIHSIKRHSWKPSILTGYEPSRIGQFDQALQRDLSESKVYARNKLRDSHRSMASSAVQSLGWSFFSKRSLAAISSISVINLPIYPRDLWNPQFYQRNDKLEYDNLEDLPFSDNASIMTAKTGLDSLIEGLLAHEVPDYKIALLG